MLLQKIREVKHWIGENKNDLFIAASFLFIALLGFGLGRLSLFWQNKPGIAVEQIRMNAVESQRTNSVFLYVASKNGAAYYLPACSGVSRIKEENKVWFSSAGEAEELGYRPAKNCPGL